MFKLTDLDTFFFFGSAHFQESCLITASGQFFFLICSISGVNSNSIFYLNFLNDELMDMHQYYSIYHYPSIIKFLMECCPNVCQIQSSGNFSFQQAFLEWDLLTVTYNQTDKNQQQKHRNKYKDKYRQTNKDSQFKEQMQSQIQSQFIRSLLILKSIRADQLYILLTVLILQLLLNISSMDNLDPQPQLLFNSMDRFIYPISNQMDLTIGQLCCSENSTNKYENYLKKNIFKPKNYFIDKRQTKRSVRDPKLRTELGLSEISYQFNKDIQIKSSRQYKRINLPASSEDSIHSALDWSSQNLLGIGLKRNAYCWNLYSEKAYEIYKSPLDRYISSMKFDHQKLIAIGDTKATITIVDIQYYKVLKQTTEQEKRRLIRQFVPHLGKISHLDWNRNLLASGSRSGFVSIQDLRAKNHILSYKPHRINVTSLKWSQDGTLIATGGGDSNIIVFDIRSQRELVRYSDFNGMIKTIDWCPSHYGIFIGGSSKENVLRFFNMKNLQVQHQINTQLPIFNVAFSNISNQLVTCHGYTSNQLSVWVGESGWKDKQKIKKSKSMKGHLNPVIHLAKSPDGENIATAAKDRTIRFWHAFKNQQEKQNLLEINDIR